MAPPGFMPSLHRCMSRAVEGGTSGGDQREPGELKPRAGKTGLIGVTLHKRTQRYEGHVWLDKKQIYLGAYDMPEQAGSAHDLMAIKSKASPRPEDLNFPELRYAELLPFLDQMPQAELVTALRTYSKSPEARTISAALGRSRRAAAGAASRASSGMGGGLARTGSATLSRSSSGWDGGGGGGGGSSGWDGGVGASSSLRQTTVGGTAPGSAFRSVSARGANKRKAPTPTASVTDMESLERQLLLQQAAQEQAAQAQRAGGDSGGGGGGSMRPRRRAASLGVFAAGHSGTGCSGTSTPVLGAVDSTADAAAADGTPHLNQQQQQQQRQRQQQQQQQGLPLLAPRVQPHLGASSLAPAGVPLLGTWQGPCSPLKIKPLQGLQGMLTQGGSAMWPGSRGGGLGCSSAIGIGIDCGGSSFDVPPDGVSAVHQKHASPPPPQEQAPAPILATPPPCLLWPRGTIGSAAFGGMPFQTPLQPPQHPVFQAELPAVMVERQLAVLLRPPSRQAEEHGAASPPAGMPGQPEQVLEVSARQQTQMQVQPERHIHEQNAAHPSVQAAVGPLALPLLNPAVASRAARELASIEAALRLLQAPPRIL